jgi:hypothetical protein
MVLSSPFSILKFPFSFLSLALHKTIALGSKPGGWHAYCTSTAGVHSKVWRRPHL